MSTVQDLDQFYHKVGALAREKNELTSLERTIVLFRVAYETALDDLGPVGAVHAASRMMTMTLAILDETNFEDILENFDTDSKMPN
jgi:hypothetical protein